MNTQSFVVTSIEQFAQELNKLSAKGHSLLHARIPGAGLIAQVDFYHGLQFRIKFDQYHYVVNYSLIENGIVIESIAATKKRKVNNAPVKA